jgi:hypothetical protein
MSWTGKLFVYMDNEGVERVSLALPNGQDNTTPRVFAVNGPYIPIGLQKSIAVVDVDAWLALLKGQDFTITPGTAD